MSMTTCCLLASPGESSGHLNPLRDKPVPWLRYFPEFRPGLQLPLSDEVMQVTLSPRKLKVRVWRGGEQSIEPLYLFLKPGSEGIEKTAMRYARKDSYHEAVRELHKLLTRTTEGNTEKRIRLPVTRDLYRYLDPKALTKRFSSPHHNLTLNARKLRENRKAYSQLLYELDPLFKRVEQQRILAKLRHHDSIAIDQVLLTSFAKKMVRKFVVYKGPNCFHAALAFHNRALTRSRYFNVIEETGYHRAMINYDELWRILSNQFSVVDHRVAPLRYGDILVFFDLPKGSQRPVNFRWIRHTATYLFNGYTFSKGSKSADTPYTIKTLSEEWKTWSRIAKNPVVKIFRRSTKHVRKRPSQDLMDWIY